MFCPMCGFRNLDADNFCGSCGHDLRSEGIHSLDLPTPGKGPRTYEKAAFAPSPSLNFEYAGFWRRFIAFWVDRLILIVPILITSSLVNILFTGGVSVGNTDSLIDNLFEHPVASSQGMVVLADIILIWLYFAIFESSKMLSTPGKRLIGIRVTDSEGNRIAFGRATVRHFSKILSTLVFLVGFLMIGFSSKKQGLHDKIAGCLVLKMKSGE